MKRQEVSLYARRGRGEASRGEGIAYGEQERALVVVGFGAVGLGGHDGDLEGGDGGDEGGREGD